MVVTIPVNNIKTHPVMELVEFSRAASKESFSIWYHDVTVVIVKDLKEIDRSKSYDECWNFEGLL